MKIFKFLPVAAVACLAVSCQNGGSGSLGSNSSQTDSLMYYLGELNAVNYLRQAEQDTTMKETGAKQAYLNGVRAGLAALRDGDENYNNGVMMGIQMAASFISYSEQIEMPVNKNQYLSSLSNTIMADTMPNVQLVQMEMNRIMNSIQQEKDKKDVVNSQSTLKQIAEAQKLPKIDDDLYGKVTTTTDGAILNVGDEVKVDAQLTREDGTPITFPIAPTGKIGNKRSFPDVISNAMLNLRSGESGEFLTSVHALLGNRAQQMKLKPTDVIKINIKATLVPREDNKEESKDAK